MTQSSPLPIMRAQEVVHLDGNMLKNMKTGEIVTGITPIPWAKFITDSSDPAVGVDPTVLCNYVISDRFVDKTGQRAIFQVDPASSAANKRHLVSKHLYTAWANRPSAGSFSGIELVLSDFGDAKVKSDGADYISAYSQIVYVGQYGSVNAPTKVTGTGGTTPVSFSFDIGSPKVPGGLIVPGKSKFLLRARGTRIGNNGTLNFHMRLGNNNNATDPSMYSYFGVAATDGFDFNGASLLDATLTTASAHAILTNSTDILGGSGSTTAVLERSSSPSVINFASDLFLSCNVDGKNSADNLALLGWSLEWLR